MAAVYRRDWGTQKGREASEKATARAWVSEDGGRGQIWVHSGAEQRDLPRTVLEVTEKGLQDEASVPA